MAVRLESVRLSLDDDFTSGMARAAAATALLRKSLGDLDGTNISTGRGLANTATQTDRTSAAFRRGGNDIDRYSGRLRLIADAALTLGPALIPIGAVAIPAITGLAAGFGFAAAGAGAAVVAFQGVGDALTAVNKAALEPTAANLDAARQAMQQISPAARDFVRELRDMQPAFQGVRDAAAEGLFPGLVEALDNIEPALPRIADLFERIGSAVGDLAADSAESLAGPRWAEFIAFIGREAPVALAEMARTLGDVAHGMAELWMAFTPLNQDFSGWLRDSADAFDDWATGLSQTDGFAEFTDYIRTNGPKVAEAMGSIANALLQVTQAASPLGGPVLDAIGQLADIIADLADSPLGTPLFTLAAGMAAVSRASALLGSASIGLNGLTASLKSVALAGGAFLALEAAAKGIDALRAASLGAAPDVAALAAALQQANATQFGEVFGGSLDEALAAADRAEGGFSGFLNQMDKIDGATGLVIDGFANLTGQQGAMTEVGRESEKAAQAFTSLDSALTQIAATGGIGAARDAFLELAQAQGLTADEQDRLLQLLPQIGPQLTAAVDAAAALTQADFLRDFFLGVEDGAKGAAAATETFAQSILRLNDVLEGRASMRDFEASIDAATESLKQNGKTLDISTEKGRANQAALDGIAGAALRVAESMSKAERGDFLAGARRDFIAAAEAMGVGERAAKRLATQLGLVDKTRVRPKVDLEDSPFRAKENGVRNDLSWLDRAEVNPLVGLLDRASGPLRNVKSLLDGLHDKTISVTTYLATVHRPAGSADGSTVPKGGIYADRFPYMLAPGEEVISNRHGQADRHRDLLKAINAGRLADGGTAGLTSQSVFNGMLRGLANGGTAGSSGPVGGVPAYLPINDMVNEVDRFKRATSGVVNIFAKFLREELKAAEKRRDALKEDLDAIRDHRNALRDAARSLSDSIASQFSGSDLFGAEGASFESILSGLKSEASSASQFASLALRLKALGLDGGALQALLETGNLSLLQDFAAQGSSQLAAFEAQFNQTQQFAQRAGQNAAFGVFGERLAEANAELRILNEKYDRAEERAKRFEKKYEELSNKETAATRQVGPDVAKAINDRSGNAART